MYSGDTVSNLAGTLTILCEGFSYLCVYLQEDFCKYFHLSRDLFLPRPCQLHFPAHPNSGIIYLL